MPLDPATIALYLDRLDKANVAAQQAGATAQTSRAPSAPPAEDQAAYDAKPVWQQMGFPNSATYDEWVRRHHSNPGFQNGDYGPSTGFGMQVAGQATTQDPGQQPYKTQEQNRLLLEQQKRDEAAMLDPSQPLSPLLSLFSLHSGLQNKPSLSHKDIKR